MKHFPSSLALLIGWVALFVNQHAFGQKPTPIPSRSATKETQAAEKIPAAAPTPYSPCNPVVDVCDVLKQYAALTHFRVIQDNFVGGKISLDVSGQPPEKAIDTIERTLFADGYQIVQIDPETVEIVGPGKNARNVGVQIITDAKDLPRGERVVSYLFKLSFSDVTELQQVLGQYLSPPQTYTSFLALPKSKALLITERTSVIRRLVELIAVIDVAGTPKAP
jgi:type II secretory pathway component GspD/PulD (secretin)